MSELLPDYGSGFVNVSKLLTVEKHNGMLNMQIHDIEVPWSVIQSLYECVFCIEDGDGNRNRYNMEKSVFDMQAIFSQHVPAGPNYDYISPGSYNAAYQSEIAYPRVIREMYLDKIREVKQNVWQQWERKWEQEWERSHSASIGGCQRYSNWELEIIRHESRQCFLERRRKQCGDDVEREAREAVSRFVNDYKRGYYVRARQYIFAWKYDEKLRELRISDRIGQDVKMYSTDKVGWTRSIYDISDNVNIGVFTNFGYGKSSYFRVVLKYRHIPIVPYSMYVNYYYANSRDLARYTRRYAAKRDSWITAFQFVVDTANMAESDPENFVKVWVVKEVNDMIAGLKRIVKTPREVIEDWVYNKGNTFEESSYLHVQAIDETAINHYKLYQNEMLIDFKAGKISGALHFLRSLRLLRPIYDDVEGAIATIKELAVTIVPEISNAMESISRDVENHRRQETAWQKRYHKLTRRLSQMEREINCQVNRRMRIVSRHLQGAQQRRDIYADEEANYRVLNPRYELHVRARSWCDRRLAQIRADIKARRQFLENLEKCRTLIMSRGD